MQTIDLMQNESVITESENKTITLTSHRIRQEIKESGHYKVASITLDQICSCEMHRKSNPWMLIFSVILLGGGVFTLLNESYVSVLNSKLMPFMFIGGIILVIAYFLTVRQIVSISSAGNSINFSTSGMPKEKVVKFINQIEEHRMAFLEKL